MQEVNEIRWVYAKKFLPNPGENVLVITKWGNIQNQTFTDYGMGGKKMFRPDGLMPGEDVKWWMPIPVDGWNDIREVTPKEGDTVLTMGAYGKIFSGTWRRPCGAAAYTFMPYVRDVLFWRPVPQLPDGVELTRK